MANATVALVEPRDVLDQIAAYDDQSFELIVVDAYPADLRLACIELCRTKVRPGGWLVHDDSDWPAHRPVDDLLHDWTVHRVPGFKPRPFGAYETAFYRLPATAQ